ncbi:LysR family transcriptional regulator [Aristaeella lactis]|uniref:DNA-binding transcriptional regulator, LysR family n=1 Tax=Aristaeella lactis TaxID=3046383 RepID=A0AC61PPF0_9FIRM|nr:LysR family transcriptional regulator [Aristaeella lactis]QUA53200.1 LysR family transcriptional regulator [Aristaeella lactis]SMC81858.1 DNA-binding transcriptional regulator, LysR family [Aristaeella lactis]
MTIQQLNYVITISEKGSLNKAAEVLYVTQPSLTSAVRELEKELGITLFNRGGKGVTLTNDGAEFIQYARQVVTQYDRLLEKYGKGGNLRKKFGISCQHYSFAVKSFVEMVKQFDTDEYEFAIRESKTRDVIEDVTTGKSEVGILYLSDFNRKAIGKFLKSSQLEFHPLIKCEPYVYLWKGHPLANKKSIRLEELRDYPCLSFEQGPSGAFYFAEEILSTYDYIRTIKATDRATMLNLMVGLNGYTLCSGIICEELNGSDYVAVAFEDEEEEVAAGRMEIGYIVKENMILSQMAEKYIAELKRYLSSIQN